MAFHFLKLGIKEGDFFHEIVVASTSYGLVTIYFDPIAYIEWMLNENEDTRL